MKMSQDHRRPAFKGASCACRVAVFAAAGLLASCAKEGVIYPRGPIAAAERLILINATAIMLVVVLPAIILTLAFAYWYRASNKKAAYRPDFQYSGQIELVVWAIPLMVVLLLSGVGWIGAHQLDPYKKLDSKVKPVIVQVTALDWKWLFIYPDEKVATLNQLVVPTGTPIEFSLTSATVMNAFFVPQLGSQVYTMPGMAMRLSLQADQPGDYAGFSSHFSGDGFADMRFLVHAVSPDEYKAWLAKTHGDKKQLDAKSFAALLKPSHNDAPGTYGDVAPNLFDQIMRQAVSAPAVTAQAGH